MVTPIDEPRCKAAEGFRLSGQGFKTTTWRVEGAEERRQRHVTGDGNKRHKKGPKHKRDLSINSSKMHNKSESDLKNKYNVLVKGKQERGQC